MYCTYFGFREKPFTITPNPRFVFLSKNHREAFAHLLYGIDNHGGFIVLTGEVGTGKTTVLRTVMEKLDDGQYRTALIFNPCISPLELLRSINREYGLPAEGLDNADLLDHLNRFLLEENRAGRTVVLVIDEAQNLPPQTLEQIRLISNLETDTDKLIQIVLAGQPELERLMSRPELRQLAQRVSVRYHLLPLDFEDARAYIDHRVTVAGGKGAAAFSRGALQRIFRRAGGVPRLINVACDRALLIGYTDEKRNISASMAQRAIKEIGDFGKTGWQMERLRTAWTCLLIVAAVATLIAAFHRVQRKPAPPAVVDPPSSPSAAKKVSPLSAKSVILPANDDFAAAVRWELSNTGESANAVHAFNALAKGWHVRQVKAGRKLSLPADLELLAAQRGLRLARMDTDLATLLRFDVPALLEIPLSGKKNRRYLALTGMNAQGVTVSVSPPLLGKSSFSEADLKRFWSGRAYLPWKDFNQLAHATATDASRVEILRLQILLAEAKTYGHEPTGVYDEGTMNAVKEFQKGHGIPEDGRAEETTLLLLYRDAGRFAMPRLTGKENRQKR